jgi:hypothetical protein
MFKGERKMRACLLGLFSLSLVLSACNGPAAQQPQITQEITPQVIVVTQVITQVIPPTTAVATATPEPTSTPLPPTATPTWDPLSAPIYYPLKNCVASRLYIGDKAMVSLVGGPNGIRYGRDLYYDTIVAYAQPGAILDIINGPWCSHGWIVWMVRTQDGMVGYTPEGNGDEYWLLPLKR